MITKTICDFGNIMKMHMTQTGLSRHDVGFLDLRGASDLADEHPNARFKETVSELMRSGFQLANPSRFEEACSNLMDGYDFENPDVTLICRGVVKDAPLAYGSVFLSATEDEPTLYLHNALPAETPDSVIDELNNSMDALFSKDKSGVAVGYIALEPQRGSGGLYEEAIAKLRAMDLKTIPMPFSPHGLGLLPFFAREGGLPPRPSAAQINSIVDTLMTHYGRLSDVVNIPDALKEQALSRLSANNPPELKVDAPRREMSIMRPR